MPIATLLLRESNSTSLTQAVEKALSRKPPLLQYDLNLNSCLLDFTLLSKPEKYCKTSSLDEGFESDVDTVSIVSSDGSVTTEPTKHQETDSANGSACSDSDDTDSTTTVNTIESKFGTLKSKDFCHENDEKSSLELGSFNSVTECIVNKNDSSDRVIERTGKLDATTSTNSQQVQVKSDLLSKNSPVTSKRKETYNLVDILCYTDAKTPDVLLFVIKEELFVFKFTNLEDLQSFYTNFVALKAVTNQKAYSKNFGAKFNLLQRTDSNGVTHIEISREPRKENSQKTHDNGPTSIISFNTPDDAFKAETGRKLSLDSVITKTDIQTLGRRSQDVKNDFRSNTLNKFGSLNLSKTNHQVKDFNSRQRNKSTFYTESPLQSSTTNLLATKSASIDNLLQELAEEQREIKSRTLENSLKKVWSSVEDLLKEPKRPERRRKPKGPATLPPQSKDQNELQQNILKGQYVRVNVPKFDSNSNQTHVINVSIKEKSNKFVEDKPFQYDNLQKVDQSNKVEFQKFTTTSNKVESLNRFQSLQNALTEKAKNSLPSLLGHSKPKLTTYQQFKYSEPKKIPQDFGATNSLMRTKKPETHWSDSMPRLLKKQQRSRSETRNFTPMAYRYIDTTQDTPYPSLGSTNIPPTTFAMAHHQVGGSSTLPSVPQGTNVGTFQRYQKNTNNKFSGGFGIKVQGHPQTISERLFGMSSKLKDFAAGNTRLEKEQRYSSMGELNYKNINSNVDSNLKSVIKKDDGKRKNDKKVTFSAYTTVQVV